MRVVFDGFPAKVGSAHPAPIVLAAGFSRRHSAFESLSLLHKQFMRRHFSA